MANPNISNSATTKVADWIGTMTSLGAVDLLNDLSPEFKPTESSPKIEALRALR